MHIGNIFSAFDGMSCLQLALKKAKIGYSNYYSSEIDKYSIKVAQDNFSNTIQIGNIQNVTAMALPSIGLLAGGSPCQGFSRSGKQLRFEDERSKLFFEFLRLKNELKPKYFLLENVKMRQEDEDIISSYLGVKPFKINSSLVSAQNRERLYWTNIIDIENFKMPDDKYIFLKDIVDYEVDKFINVKDYSFFPADSHNSKNGLIFLGGLAKGNKGFWNNDGKFLQRSFKQGYRVYSIEGKSVTLNASGGGLGGKTGLYEINGKIRQLTVSECEQLQNIPIGYTKSVSQSQAKKMLGNGWTVDVITHILNYLK